MKNYFNQNFSIKIFALFLLSLWYLIFLAQKIDLTTIDLGRHLKNGQMILEKKFNVLYTNFYSFTNPQHPFINHHWASGVLFYLIWKLFGFTGLHLFFITLSLIVFFLFFKLAQKNSNFKISVLFSLFLIPMIAERKEIRPEIFSYFFLALFFWILWHYLQGKISASWLILLPISGIFWVNLHINFIFGLFLIGVFLFERIFIPRPFLSDKNRVKNLTLTFVFTALSFLINPFGLKGLLYPFNIFREYGYRIIENQSVWFLQRIGIIHNPNLLLFEITFSLFILSSILLFFLNRKEFSLAFFILGATFGILAFMALRNFTIFGLFSLVILSYNFDKVFKKIKLNPETVEEILAFSFLIVAIFNLVNNFQTIFYKNNGFGLYPENNASAQFFKEKGIQGPIFNNYDIGSYLIFHLFPKEKVFVDNRPEAYPASFFQEIYIPIQENEDAWQKLSEEYNFNAIFFSYHDITPWAQKFLINRINDENWAPVFADNFAIIFLKRNDLNKEIIEKYEIPKEFFRVIKQ
jgi:hypothetical protein